MLLLSGAGIRDADLLKKTLPRDKLLLSFHFFAIHIIIVQMSKTAISRETIEGIFWRCACRSIRMYCLWNYNGKTLCKHENTRSKPEQFATEVIFYWFEVENTELFT